MMTIKLEILWVIIYIAVSVVLFILFSKREYYRGFEDGYEECHDEHLYKCLECKVSEKKRLMAVRQMVMEECKNEKDTDTVSKDLR